MITEYTSKNTPAVVSLDPKHEISSSNATITDKHNRSGSDSMITDYTAKDAPSFITLNVNANNRYSQGIHQSTNMNNNDTVEAGKET